MIAVLLAAAATASAPFGPPTAEDEVPVLGAIGPQPAGATALTATAGRPFHSVRLEHGLSDWLDVGAELDVSPDGFYRPAIEMRLRAFRAGRVQLVARALAGRAFSTTQGVAGTNDGEVGLQLAVAPLPRFGIFAEASLLGATDFTRERTAGFTQASGGLALALPGGLSLLGSLGVLHGMRGGRAIGSSGASFRF